MKSLTPRTYRYPPRLGLSLVHVQISDNLDFYTTDYFDTLKYYLEPIELYLTTEFKDTYSKDLL